MVKLMKKRSSFGNYVLLLLLPPSSDARLAPFRASLSESQKNSPVVTVGTRNRAQIANDTLKSSRGISLSGLLGWSGEAGKLMRQCSAFVLAAISGIALAHRNSRGRKPHNAGAAIGMAVGMLFLCTSLNAQTFNATGTGAIPDGGANPAPNYGAPLDVTFPVTGMTSQITNISLSITFNPGHTFIGDLDVVLAPPGVTPGAAGSFVIFSRVGATTAADFGDSSNLGGTYTFNNASANNLWTAADTTGNNVVITAQSYRTSAPGPVAIPAANTDFTAAFSGLTLAQLNGTWTLRFRDGASSDTGTVSASALTLTAPIGPSLAYNPTSGATAGTGGPVNFTGVTAVGSTGNGTIVVTPSGGIASGTTTLGSFTFSGADAAFFARTSAATLNFTAGVGAAQNVTMTCTAGAAARTANLQATETITGGATTQRFWVLNCPAPQAGVAQDGDVTLSGTFALNSYSTLSAAAASGGTSFTVTSAAALALPTCGVGCTAAGATSGNGLGTALALGDLLMLYQPQELAGAITTTNGTAFGDVTNYGSAGLYEFVSVAGVSGNVVTIDTTGGAGVNICTGLKRSYDSGAMVIRVPQLRNLTINSGGLLNPASAWNGSTGGVIALDVRPGAPQLLANGTITINGTGRINASGFGFRPGAVDNLTTFEGTNSTATQAYVANACTAGARKGESILGFAGTANGGTCGSTADNNETGAYNAALLTGSGAFNRGAIANGGGGGNSHNAGGGGGSNVGTGTWTGGGNPDRGLNNAFDDAWARDDNTLDAFDLPTVTATSTSPGGGRGGYSYSADNQNALTVNPGCTLLNPGTCAANWGGDFRLNRGGLGGRALAQQPSGDTVDRLYFGGGGGAGDGNNSSSAPGGAGGGLIFMIARRIVTDAGSTTSLILSNGSDGLDTDISGTLVGQDAPGGGGGGGSIVAMLSGEIGSNVQFSTVGGRGGNQVIESSPEAEGPGGGGGGGLIAASFASGTPTFLLTGGNSGTSTGVGPNAAQDAVTEFPVNGGTRGGAGLQVAAPPRNSSPFQCLQTGGSGTFTTPVTNTWFQSTRVGTRIDVQFTTSAEVGNLGFRLSADVAGRRVVVNELIASREVDSPMPQDYLLSISDAGYERLYLTDISITGKEVTRGPFEIGQSVGLRPVVDAYDWSTARADLAGFRLSRSAANSSTAYVRVATRGMQRVSYEAMLAAGVNLAGVPAHELAVVSRDGPVIRRVRGGASFGPGSAIEFYGDPTPDLYTRTETYLVRRGAPEVIDMVTTTPVSLPAGAMADQWATVKYAPEVRYGFSSPSPDPWFADRLLANGAPASYSFTMSAPAAIDPVGVLKVSLWGGLNYPAGALPDHHVRVLFNDVLVADHWFDGLTPWDVEIPVSNLVAGNNTIRFELPRDTGNQADLLHLDSLQLNYLRTPAFVDGRLYGAGMRANDTDSDLLFADGIGDSFVGPAPINYRTITLPGLGSSTRNFRIDAGTPTELLVAMGRSIETGALGETSEIWMSQPEGLFAPAISAAPAPLALPTVQADYWVITHGLFAPSLQSLLARRQQQGLQTAMIDVEQIYLAYSAGNPDPKAILRFMREVAGPLGARYLLLVGGDTYDAPGYLNSGSISFIPTLYQRTNEIVAFAPVDPAFGDLTGDGVPEISVGRLPVRTVAEANESVRKILDYDAQPAMSRLMAVSGAADTNQGLNFQAASQSFQATFPSAWQQTNVYSDTLGVLASQVAVRNGFNSGQSIVSYIGHSSPTQWGFEALLTSAQVSGLAANANAPLVFQFGCWTTYFTLPSANSMSHALMLTPGRGASGVLGSTVLLDQPSHDLMAGAIGPLLVSGQRIGDVVVTAKRQIANALEGELRGTEIFLGISLMGDPAQQIR